MAFVTGRSQRHADILARDLAFLRFCAEVRRMDGTANNKGVSPDNEPRLLRFTVDDRFCYGMKWRDERTENRREIDYVIREAGEDVIICLLVDAPLRIVGTPDLIAG